ncbi:MAG: UTP--glucose-1-phosphate uridylyltransferase [Deltaproteobacteria bacterium]|nr:UTP--glucose-1-phosphate uridylyltransferase [Deltaproteobacteria bacterium]
MSVLEELGLASDELELVHRYRLDAQAFAHWRDELVHGRFPLERNRDRRALSLPRPEDLTPWPEPGSREATACEEAGAEAIAQGQVAVAILNGGMATRFGGKVKGVVEVVDGHSFLALRLSDLARAPGRVPVFLMNSFATDADTAAHLESNRWFGLDRAEVHGVPQRVSIRVTPTGDMARDSRGHVLFYAPGHGDIFEVLAESVGFQRFAAAGGRVVMVSNVDNLAATLSPKVVGAHLTAGRPVTVEVAPRAPADRGGAPVRVGGRVEVLEGFRFPPEFDINKIPVFNTNTMLFDVSMIRSDHALSWFRADKTVDGRQVVQFERLMGEVTAQVDATYLSVPRDGPESRFMPVKTPEDLIAVRPAVRQRFGRERRNS